MGVIAWRKIRRHFMHQFTLKHLLISVTLISLGSACLAFAIRPERPMDDVFEIIDMALRGIAGLGGLALILTGMLRLVTVDPFGVFLLMLIGGIGGYILIIPFIATLTFILPRGSDPSWINWMAPMIILASAVGFPLSVASYNYYTSTRPLKKR